MVLEVETSDGRSLSARRAWIEIRIFDYKERTETPSLSARRAWIEMEEPHRSPIQENRRSPQGERG